MFTRGHGFLTHGYLEIRFVARGWGLPDLSNHSLQLQAAAAATAGRGGRAGDRDGCAMDAAGGNEPKAGGP